MLHAYILSCSVCIYFQHIEINQNSWSSSLWAGRTDVRAEVGLLKRSHSFPK